MTGMNEYCPDEAAPLELIGIDGAPMLDGAGNPMTISLLGEDSDVAVAHRNATTNRRIQQGQRGAAVVTAEALNADEAAYFAKLTVGWNVAFGAESAEFSQDAARKIYMNPKLSFVTDQVRDFVKARKNFLRPVKPS